MKMSAEKVMKKGKRKVRRIVVEGANNGFTVEHHMEPNMKRMPGGMMMADHGEPSPKPSVFGGPKAHKQMVAHVANLAQQMGGDDEQGESMPASPAMAAQG